jgi:hypothetical protein
MFMCGGFFLFLLLAQHTHAAMHISRPKARTPITTPATMAATGGAPFLLLPLLLWPLLSESPPPRLAAGVDGESLDGAAGKPLSAGAGGDNALLFCGVAVGGDSDAAGCDGEGGEGGGEPDPEELDGGADGVDGGELEGGGDDVSSLGGDGDPEESSEPADAPSMLSSGDAMIINV